MDSRAERYKRLEKLGEGTYGSVFKAEDRVTGETVAMKIVAADDEESGLSMYYLRETSILKGDHGYNVMKLRDTFVVNEKAYIIMDYCEYNLFSCICKKGMKPSHVAPYAFQILSGVYCLHRDRIMHRDLKPSNILIDAKGVLRITDFGLSRFFTVPNGRYTGEVVSLPYRAPEILLKIRDYDPSIDMWSAGCILAELAIGKLLFPADCEAREIMEIFRTLGDPGKDYMAIATAILPNGFEVKQTTSLAQKMKGVDPLLVDLVSKMVVYDPAKRINARDAMFHPFFDSVNPNVKRKCCPDLFK